MELNDPLLASIQYLLLHSFLAEQQLTQLIQCRYIGIRAHNTDYVNRKLAESMNIKVMGLTRQHGVNAVAEHTLALLFALTKHLLPAHQNILGRQWRSNLPLNIELYGKKLGIIGFGKIGKRVGEIGTLLGMEVLVAGKGIPASDREMRLDDVLAQADVIVILIPGTETNYHFINEARIGQMKDGVILINTARGSVLDYQALAAAIQSGKIAGVGLDVYPNEPVGDFQLAKQPNVICTPHMAYATHDALEMMNDELAENLIAFLNAQSND